jgi:hypothetical protein
VTFRTGEVDIGTSQDELWDKTRSLFGILEGDISIFRKVIGCVPHHKYIGLCHKQELCL